MNTTESITRPTISLAAQPAANPTAVKQVKPITNLRRSERGIKSGLRSESEYESMLYSSSSTP
ncbi:hypothetical protein NDI45_22945 [Leptolyngbya sp. GB1-A1]|uniref:hypothetical protein n=1 Tax=Leptolyngbya sp. GB1-A1 TaxID=2933908 RepID=UPI0032987F62